PTLSTLSISRVCVTGIRLVTFAAASVGLGSGTLSMIRVTVGRMLSVTMSPSLICGVTFMMNPMGTTFCVVVKVVVDVVWLVTVSALIVKYTRLSTTFSIAVWLLSTMSLGLESTRVLPNASSSLIVLEMLPPTAALGLL